MYELHLRILFYFFYIRPVKSLIFVILFFIAINGFSQVEWLNPKPSGYSIKKIYFTDQANGYLYNSNGDVFKTADTGNTWLLHKQFPRTAMFDMKDSTAVVAGYINSYYSLDNGNTWQTTASFNDEIRSVDIVDKNVVYVLTSLMSSSPTLYRSVNRGESWNVIPGNLPPGARKIEFVTTDTGYCISNNGIFKTVNGGTNWVLQYGINNTASVIAIRFLDTERGYVYRQSTGMLYTSDGGATWNLSTTVNDDISDIFIVNQSTAYASGEYGVHFKTTNGGVTWSWVSASNRIYQYGLYSQYFFDAEKGLTAGARGRILKTWNGGGSWQWYSPTYIDFTDINMTDVNTGYASTWNHLYKTSDSGNSWNQLPLSVGTAQYSSSRFQWLHFRNKDTGFVTSSHPSTIHRTTNGGQNWTSANPFGASYESIAGISFFHPDSGYASLKTCCGGAGIFKTADAGVSWQQVGSNQNFNKLFFANARTGYASNYSGLWRSIDSAKTWTQVLFLSSGSINDIYFVTPAKGVVVGSAYNLNVTSDSGRTWKYIQSTAIRAEVTRIRFFSTEIGFLLLKNGDICKTIDGGFTWQKTGDMSFSEGAGISYTADSSMYAAGWYGSIVRAKILPVDSTVNTVKGCGNTGMQLISNLSGSAYQWQVDTGNGFFNLEANANYYNTTSKNMTINNVSRSFGGYKYRCIVDGNSSVNFRISIENVWTGASDQQWSNPANWSCGFVPDEKTDVVINSGTVIINSHVIIRSLTMDSAVQLTINPGFSLTVLN